MNPEIAQLKSEVQKLKQEMVDMHFLLHRKTSGGSADIRGKIVNPSTVAATIAAGSITSTMLGSNSVIQSKWASETVAVTVSAGASSGTGTCTSGSIIIGWRPTGNIDQFVDSIAVSGTTVTVTLGANATADNTFSVILLKSA